MSEAYLPANLPILVQVVVTRHNDIRLNDWDDPMGLADSCISGQGHGVLCYGELERSAP